MSSLRIIFMGSPEMALPSLQYIHESSHEMIAVISQPDRPVGRGQHTTPTPISQYAKEKNIPLFQTGKIRKDPALIGTLQSLKPDLIVVVAFGQKIPPSLISLPRKGTINLHFSLLPQYRGAAPVQWALLNQEKETGISVFFLVSEMDAGPVLTQKSVPIQDAENAGELGTRLAHIGAAVLLETINQLASDSLTAIPQDPAKITHAPLLKKEDALIDWRQPAEVILARIRGLNPWPGTFTFLNEKRLKVFKAEVLPLPESKESVAGLVLMCQPTGIIVACGENALCLKEVQMEGKSRMPISQFLSGHVIEKGTRLGHHNL